MTTERETQDRAFGFSEERRIDRGECCACCRFRGFHVAGFYRCRRRAPTVGAHEQALWPAVHGFQWCGDFEPCDPPVPPPPKGVTSGRPGSRE